MVQFTYVPLTLCRRQIDLENLDVTLTLALRTMANDPELNIGNNIGMRETVFPHVFAKNIVKSP